MKCKRCGERITLYAVGERYCRLCVRDLTEIAARTPKVIRFPFAKDLGGYPRGAA